MDNVYFLCLFLCRSHESSFDSSFALQTTFFIILVEGESFSIVSSKQDKMLLQFFSYC